MISWNTATKKKRKKKNVKEAASSAPFQINTSALCSLMPFRGFLKTGLEGKVGRSYPRQQKQRIRRGRAWKQALCRLFAMCPSINHLTEKAFPNTRLSASV